MTKRAAKLHKELITLYHDLKDKVQEERNCQYCWRPMTKTDDNKYYCKECDCEMTA